ARLRHLGARRAALTTEATAAVQQLRDLLECVWPAVLTAAASPFRSKTWCASLAVVLERCAGDPRRVRRLGLGGWCFSRVADPAAFAVRDNDHVTLGRTPKQADLLCASERFCEGRVSPESIYGVLHRECFALFPDEMFADLFTDVGRRSVPPMIVAVVMVLQRIEGCSDREAVDRFAFDVRWKYAAGGLAFDHPGFVHTVLVDMRARLARSKRPNRIFEASLDAARRAGLVGRRRVLDSTPLYDAVATMDTVTLIRSAIRGLLAVADTELETVLRAVLRREDDYRVAGKPVCDYDDKAAREALVDALARDAMALLAVLEGRELAAEVSQAGALLATVVGQDLDEDTTDGVFRIARRVAKDRVISTVDPQSRHGHKTAARGFDGYQGHVGIDPDSEIITATTVTPGNAGDGGAAADLITDLIPAETHPEQPIHPEQPAQPGPEQAGPEQPADQQPGPERAGKVFGDCAYGSGEFQSTLEEHGLGSGCKTQPPAPRPGGLFTKDRFDIDLDHDTVTCPHGVTTPIRRGDDGAGTAHFGAACAGCPLRAQCTTSKAGRTVTVSAYEAELARARARQSDPTWQADYTATRPKVERKIGHLMRRKHGGRRARMRGLVKVAADFALLAAAVNLARLGKLGCASTTAGSWTVVATA
ncbi:MAG TPA: transposase, partial [Pseudonocardiaceae bacterium]